MTRRVLHLIPQAHLDPVWLWPVRDGAAEALTTLQSAVDRAAETPAFTFTRSSSCVYQWAKEMDPALYGAIGELVRAGRWEIVGGWIEQPDCNLPSAESFIRQGLYGKRFFTDEFGAKGTTTVGYNPDSFGHCGGLPQLLAHTGFDAYAFMRPQPADNPDLPLLFWWEAPDGSRVLGCRIHKSYSQSYAITDDELEAWVREAARECFLPGIGHGAMWFGVGNHGGGPTRAHVARILELQRDASLPEIRFSSVKAFLAAVRKTPGARRLKVVRGELGYAFRGCYSATGEVKQLHRLCEKTLHAAEAIEVMADGAQADPAALRGAWRRLLFNQFHDILAGTCVPSVQEETRSRFGAVLTEARERRLRGAFRMARRVDTRAETGSVLFAANPLPWPRKAVVQLDTFMEPHGRAAITGLETRDGQPVPVQWLRADANFGPWGLKWGKLTAVLDLPAGGWRCYRVATRPLPQRPPEPPPQVDERNLQFGAGQAADAGPVVTTREPALASWRAPGLPEILSRPAGVVVLRDPHGPWAHDVAAFEEELGRPEITETETLESGPLVTVTRQKSRWQSSEIWMDVVRYAHTPVVELRFRINWQERRQQLKLEIPTRLKGTMAVAKMPAEAVQRPADGREYPCHDWVALQGRLRGKPATVALLNDSSYSCSARDGVLRMILVRGVPHAEHPPFDYKDTRNVAFLDHGWQERRFWLLAGPGGWQDLDLDRQAQEWQIPAEHMLDSPHPGTEPWSGSLFSIRQPNVECLALKPAEDGKAAILRLRETHGRRTTATVELAGRRLALPLKPLELATFRIGRTVRRVDGLEASQI